MTGEGAVADAAAATVQDILDYGGEAIADANSVATSEGGAAPSSTPPCGGGGDASTSS